MQILRKLYFSDIQNGRRVKNTCNLSYINSNYYIHFITISDSKMLNGSVKKLGSSQQLDKAPQIPSPESYMHKEKTFLRSPAVPSGAVFCIIST